VGRSRDARWACSRSRLAQPEPQMYTQPVRIVLAAAWCWVVEGEASWVERRGARAQVVRMRGKIGARASPEVVRPNREISLPRLTTSVMRRADLSRWAKAALSAASPSPSRCGEQVLFSVPFFRAGKCDKGKGARKAAEQLATPLGPLRPSRQRAWTAACRSAWRLSAPESVGRSQPFEIAAVRSAAEVSWLRATRLRR